MIAVSATPTLEPGQHVTLRHDKLGTLPATVEFGDGRSVTVALAVREERVARLVGQRMAVELVSGRGIHRYGGVLASQDRGSLTIGLSGEVERIQRREFARIGAVLDVTVRGIDADVGGTTSTLDLSGRGMRIADPWKLPLDIAVRVELALPEPPPLRLLGRVVRVADTDQKGIRFDGVERADENRLLRYVRDRELAALRAARG